MVSSLVSAPRRASVCSHPWKQKMWIGRSLCIEGKTCWYISDLRQEREARWLRRVKSEERIVIVYGGQVSLSIPSVLLLLSEPSRYLFHHLSFTIHSHDLIIC